MKFFRLIAIFILLFFAAAPIAHAAELDGTDGPSLDGSFFDVIEGLSESDKRKAATGFMLIVNEVRRGRMDPNVYEKSLEEALFLVNPTGGNTAFQSRGSVLNQIAEMAGKDLTGLTAQSLIDHYHITSGRIDELIKDREEARLAAEAEAKENAETRKMEVLAKHVALLTERLDALETDVVANEKKRAATQSALDKAREAQNALEQAGRKMVEDVPLGGKKIQRSAYDVSGVFVVMIKNTTDKPIQEPRVSITFTPKQGDLLPLSSGELRLYKGEQRSISIPAGGAQAFDYNVTAKPPVDYSVNPGGSGKITDYPTDLSDYDVTATVVSYKGADGVVSLTPSKAELAALGELEATLQACEASDALIQTLDATLPDEIRKLSAMTVSEELPELKSPAATRC